MANAVVVELDADEKKLFKKFAALERKQEKMEQKFGKVGRAGAKAGKNIEKGFGTNAISGTRKLITILTGAGGVLAAFRLITAEIQNQVELQNKAAERTITLASARKDVIRNLPGASPGDIKQVLQSGTQIASQTSIEEKFIQKAFAQALSASGGNIPASRAAVLGSARFLSDKPEEIAGFAGSLLDLSKVTGTNDANTNLGLLQAVGGLSRVVDPRAQAQTIPGALIGQRAFGSTTTGAAALFSTLTTESADILGRKSGTGAISLAQQLSVFLPKLATTTERIVALQSDQRLGQKFLNQASFEKKVLGPIQQLISNPNSSAAQSFRSNLQAFPGSNEAFAQAGAQTLNKFSIDPLERTARLDRTFTQFSEQLSLLDRGRGEAGVVRKGVLNVLRETGQAELANKLDKVLFEIGTGLGAGDVLSTSRGFIDKKIASLEAFRPLSNPVGTRFQVGEFLRPDEDVVFANGGLRRKPLPEDLKTANILRKLLVVLERIEQTNFGASTTTLGEPDRDQP